MSDNLLSSHQQVDDKFQTLLHNASAARAISQIVEGTIGPKGLDVMMVDRFGDVVISNDGVTILKFMEVNHPAARMIINTAQAQQEEVGDGTTTTTIIAGALVAEGCSYVLKGVPVTRVIEGINYARDKAVELIRQQTIKIDDIGDELLFNVACIAGRGQKDLASLILQGAKLVGKEKLCTRDYRMADAVWARELAENEVFMGTVINREPVNDEMPRRLENPVILVIDDALQPVDAEHEVIKTEAGFKYYIKAREEYEKNLHRICDAGINVVVVDRSVDDIAEQIFTERGVMVFSRVASLEIDNLCRHTGAKKVKKAVLKRDAETIRSYAGRAKRVEVDEKLKHTCFYEGSGEKWATIIVGASTEEVVEERERIAKDAASALQAALRGGVVPGGGAIEVWLAQHMEEYAKNLEGAASFGVLCFKEALLKPFYCLAANAGFNPLEKMGEVWACQNRKKNSRLTFDSDTGKIIDAVEKGIVDPAPVKIHALKAASEVATAILRINTVIRMKDDALKKTDMKKEQRGEF
ncbi:Chaperonin GroEL (HSP60 family) [Thermosyntropha lipolytica DSM 11003]|uniref:Chaperonin GroEL (HSP60 family) n=1 Tax=Thermosyntropha lipolytica DSM 11003 TaxID=1123382 RepID=A0A1M5N791_9FIRM|nr:TCP-1/cpn60 chaperonin family protein [Thermosyntropha lipolytica]SHG85361.1 Chaperonin GroEL (HSP60 family) [Thermosyntropha lipolytica DSM 11003]